ncbi:MAG: hypothetical protein ACODAE_06775, partial [Gemmatimonadota bacterium]
SGASAAARVGRGAPAGVRELGSRELVVMGIGMSWLVERVHVRRGLESRPVGPGLGRPRSVGARLTAAAARPA